MVGFATALNPPYLLKPEPRSPISIRLAVADVRGNGRDGVDHGVLVQQPDGLRPGRDGGEREHSGSGFDGGVNVKRRNAETPKRRNAETPKRQNHRRGAEESASLPSRSSTLEPCQSVDARAKKKDTEKKEPGIPVVRRRRVEDQSTYLTKHHHQTPDDKQFVSQMPFDQPGSQRLRYVERLGILWIERAAALGTAMLGQMLQRIVTGLAAHELIV